MMRPGDRQLKANAFVRQLDEIAAREGCELPVPLLIAMVKLFGEALEWQLDAPAEARYEFTRCGAIERLSRRCPVFADEVTPADTLLSVVPDGARSPKPQRTTPASVK